MQLTTALSPALCSGPQPISDSALKGLSKRGVLPFASLSLFQRQSVR